MKKKGSNCDYIEARNENLKREFLARLGKNGRTVREAIAAMAMARADRFYINEERALSEIRRMRENAAAGRVVGPERIGGSGRVGGVGRVVGPERRGGSGREGGSGRVGRRNPRRMAMICEINRRVDTLLSSRPDLSLAGAVYEVVNSPAPAFYISAGTMRTLLYEIGAITRPRTPSSPKNYR